MRAFAFAIPRAITPYITSSLLFTYLSEFLEDYGRKFVLLYLKPIYHKCQKSDVRYEIALYQTFLSCEIRETKRQTD